VRAGEQLRNRQRELDNRRQHERYLQDVTPAPPLTLGGLAVGRNSREDLFGQIRRIGRGHGQSLRGGKPSAAVLTGREVQVDVQRRIENVAVEPCRERHANVVTHVR